MKRWDIDKGPGKGGAEGPHGPGGGKPLRNRLLRAALTAETSAAAAASPAVSGTAKTVETLVAVPAAAVFLILRVQDIENPPFFSVLGPYYAPKPKGVRQRQNFYPFPLYWSASAHQPVWEHKYFLAPYFNHCIHIKH